MNQTQYNDPEKKLECRPQRGPLWSKQNSVALPYIDLAAAPRLDRGSTLQWGQVILCIELKILFPS